MLDDLQYLFFMGIGVAAAFLAILLGMAVVVGPLFLAIKWMFT